MFRFLKQFVAIIGVGSVLVGIASVGLIAREARAGHVTELITCPKEVTGYINLPNKIGSDPAFSPLRDKIPIVGRFGCIGQSLQNRQYINCIYLPTKISNGGGISITTQVGAGHPAGCSITVSGPAIHYHYTVKKKINYCKKAAENILECPVAH